MKRILLGMALLLVGCGDDDPASSAPALDTSVKEQAGSYNIRIWNTRNLTWEESEDRVNVTVEWRFVSLSDLDDGVTVKGGYTVAWENTIGGTVKCVISQLKFYDANKIPLAEYDVYPDDEFNLGAYGTSTRNGTFFIWSSDMAPSFF